MVTIMESDKIIFVNIKNSYEALRNNDRRILCIVTVCTTAL